MNAARLEHVNLTVRDPHAVAELMCRLFGWRVRWEGDAIHGGRSVHVGGEHDYLALYSMGEAPARAPSSYATLHGLNHVALVVDDLDEVERRVVAEGFEPHSHADYEPGRRFYFRDGDGLEFEVVSYAGAPQAG